MDALVMFVAGRDGAVVMGFLSSGQGKDIATFDALHLGGTGLLTYGPLAHHAASR